MLGVNICLVPISTFAKCNEWPFNTVRGDLEYCMRDDTCTPGPCHNYNKMYLPLQYLYNSLYFVVWQTLKTEVIKCHPSPSRVCKNGRPQLKHPPPVLNGCTLGENFAKREMCTRVYSHFQWQKQTNKKPDFGIWY